MQAKTRVVADSIYKELCSVGMGFTLLNVLFDSGGQQNFNFISTAVHERGIYFTFRDGLIEFIAVKVNSVHSYSVNS